MIPIVKTWVLTVEIEPNNIKKFYVYAPNKRLALRYFRYEQEYYGYDYCKVMEVKLMKPAWHSQKTSHTTHNMNSAAVASNKIAVTHSVHPDLNREMLIINVPNGWDDVAKLVKKVLTYDGRDFTFCGWNSDTCRCYFVRPINGKSTVATVNWRGIPQTPTLHIPPYQYTQ